ncbi:MAG: dockerin type I repeat-containing protein [Eubacteriales bacterium]|nr:dockerin type I repeat-containing protein [Eubacteriales bacterium]
MKSVSNHSYAKTVHTLKSIGKVLLPVALLLAAILCIGVAAGAASTDVTYTDLGNGQHVKMENGSATIENHTYGGASCAEVWFCPCGATQAHESDGKHVESFVVAPQYLKKADKCAAKSTYYTSCTACNKVLTNTFVAGEKFTDGRYHSFTVEKVDAKYLDNNPVCNNAVEYYKSCACGESSAKYPEYAVKFATSSTWPHTLKQYNGEKDNELPGDLKVKDLLVTAPTCSAAGVYHDYCSVCGAVLASTSTYGSADHSYVQYYNATSHWTACKICGAVDEEHPAAAHSYAKDDKATCDHEVKCVGCDYVAVPKLAHELVHTAEKPATCIASGIKEYWTCKNCKKMFSDAAGTKVIGETETIKALGHVIDPNAPACNPGKCQREGCNETINAWEAHKYASDAYKITNVEGKKVTVQSPVCDAKCTVCGTQVKAKGHDYETKKVEPTCTDKGKEWKECKVCHNVIDVKELAPAGHKFNTTALCMTPARCTVCDVEVKSHHVLPANFDASTLKCTDSVRCTRCGAELAGRTKHETTPVDGKDATCTDKGNKSGYKCSFVITINGVDYPCTYHEGGEEIPAKGHKWSAWKVTVEPTCQTVGKQVRTCSECHETEKKDVAKTPDTHKWSDDYKYSGEKHWRYCTVPGCNEISEFEGHSYHYTKDGKNWIDSNGAVCQYDGVCKVCGYVQKASAEHKYGWAHDDKNHWKVCSVCGTTTDKVAHDLVNVPKKDATCGKDGYEAHKACECGWSNETWNVIKATGKHTWSAYSKCDKDGKANKDKKTAYQYHIRTCTTCKQTEKAKCVSDGKRDCLTNNKCKTCKLDMMNTKGKLSGAAYGHNFTKSETVISADAHSWTCARCGIVASEKHVSDAKAACLDGACKVCGVAMKATAKHTPSDDIQRNASGHSYVCTVCDSTITAEGHRVNEALNDCTKGLKCSVCGYEIMAPQEAHAFDLENVIPAVPATCTEDGHTAYYKCKNCSVTTVQAVIKATGHKWVDVAAKPATETEDGYTAHKACSVCGEKDASYQVIPKLGGDVRDVNGDGKFTSDDAIALLYLTFGNPDIKYDFNGDGKVTSDDAVKLLYMSF